MRTATGVPSVAPSKSSLNSTVAFAHSSGTLESSITLLVWPHRPSVSISGNPMLAAEAANL